jgi:hypothetical protein
MHSMNGPQRGTVASTPVKRSLTANDHDLGRKDTGASQRRTGKTPERRSLNEAAWRANGKASEAVTDDNPTREERRSAHDGGMVGAGSRLVRSALHRPARAIAGAAVERIMCRLVGEAWRTNLTHMTPEAFADFMEHIEQIAQETLHHA